MLQALQEKFHTVLGEELLALDQRDSQVVPQLILLQAHSTRALTKALATCNTDLVLYVLLHSYDVIIQDDTRLDVASVASTLGGPDVQELFVPFYRFVRAPAGETDVKGLRERSDGIWNSFVQAMIAPLPHVSEVCSSANCACHCKQCNREKSTSLRVPARALTRSCANLVSAAPPSQSITVNGG
jgi:hypothetical protein